MIKKLSATLIVLGLAFTLLVSGAGQGNADARKKADRRPCVSLAEFRAIRGGMTQKQVRNILDTPGGQIIRVDDGYWEGAWFDDGHWDSYYVDEGYYDENGWWVDAGYWQDDWIDTSYYDDFDHWVSMIDTVRAYKKCRSFDRGRSRIGINFDNYSSRFSGMRLYSKRRSNPWSYIARENGRSVVPDKTAPHATKPSKPAPKPLTPDPHPGKH